MLLQFQPETRNPKLEIRMKPKEALTVRAHHLGCLAHFAAFGGTHATLPILLAAVREDPERRVRVVAGPDDICVPCPFWDGVRCNREPGMEEKNRAKDRAFLDALGLKDGETKTARELSKLVRDRLTLDVLTRFCPDCLPGPCADAVARGAWEGRA